MTGKYAKLRRKIVSGGADRNIDFTDLCSLLLHLGFDQRTKGSHHIFMHAEIEEIINLQPKGNKAKPYQVRQVRNILVKYRFGDVDVD